VEHRTLLGQVLLDHVLGRNVAVIGDKGSGKSAFSRHLAAVLDYPVTFVYLYKDMTARELLSRRSTDEEGNTVWLPGPLVRAAVEGSLCVLDGLDRVASSTVSALAQLLQDRDLTLFDGTRLLRLDRYQALLTELGEDELRLRKVLPIHPRFRVLALASPMTRKTPWLTPEILSLFSWHSMPDLSTESTRLILNRRFPALQADVMDRLLRFAALLNEAATSLSAPTLALSLRHLLRVGKHVSRFGPTVAADIVGRVLLLQLLPSTLHESVVRALADSQLGQPSNKDGVPAPKLELTDSSLQIGNVSFPRCTPTNPELVPQVLFYDIPKHVWHLQDLLRDLSLPEKHVLLIGTQGVGKNKLVDRLLELLRLEREYMQLHRDTSIAQLTSTPSMSGGKICYVDSPLVRAVVTGRVLVVDEADKAALEVVSIIKGLVEDGQMMLADGRHIMRADLADAALAAAATHAQSSKAEMDSAALTANKSIVRMHPNFRMIILANKAGFPFLGNGM
jgi:MoxR-like ATPase